MDAVSKNRCAGLDLDEDIGASDGCLPLLSLCYAPRHANYVILRCWLWLICRSLLRAVAKAALAHSSLSNPGACFLAKDSFLEPPTLSHACALFPFFSCHRFA